MGAPLTVCLSTGWPLTVWCTSVLACVCALSACAGSRILVPTTPYQGLSCARGSHDLLDHPGVIHRKQGCDDAFFVCYVLCCVEYTVVNLCTVLG